MAYLNLGTFEGLPAAAPADLVQTRPAATGLSALEWQVVALAQRDSLSTLHAPGRLSIALGMIFGGQRANPRLADPRLEALRRLSVLAWHRGHTLPPFEIEAFHAAGFTADQFETLLASISRGRAARNQGRR